MRSPDDHRGGTGGGSKGERCKAPGLCDTVPLSSYFILRQWIAGRKISVMQQQACCSVSGSFSGNPLGPRFEEPCQLVEDRALASH